MTKDAALQNWFSQFMPAYPEASVPEDAAFPWLTYELQTAAWGDGETPLTVNLWFYTESEARPNAKAQELAAAVGRSGVLLPCDGGAIWLKRGSPWCQNIRDENDKNIKRRYINLTAEYLTED